jgi:hypothetical protein
LRKSQFSEKIEGKGERMFQKFPPTLAALYLRALKGAPLTNLFYLGDRPQPPALDQELAVAQRQAFAQGQSVAQLSRLTGYSRNTVREALALLVELRLVDRFWVRGARGRIQVYRLVPRDRLSPLDFPAELAPSQPGSGGPGSARRNL